MREASRARAAVAPLYPRQERFAAAFLGVYKGRPYWERYARSLAHALVEQPVILLDDERLVGMIYQTTAVPTPPDPHLERALAPYSPWAQMRARQEREIEPTLRVGGAPGHIGWRWDWILSRGVEGVMRELRQRLAQNPDADAKRFYRGALILWRAVLRWNERHVRALEERAAQARGEEGERPRELAAICRRVPRLPARTFREAVQSFYFQHLALMFENPFGGNGPGRLDLFLWPYLQRDLAAGRVTLDQARELIDELFIRFEERLPQADGWVEAIMVGGRAPDGSLAVNPLSEIIVRSTIALRQTHPAVYVRLTADTPPPFLALAVEYLLEGENRAQIYNDEACLPAIVSGGVSAEDAPMYMAGGCMEISPQGMNCDLNWAGTFNVAKTLELVLNGGCDLLDGRRCIPHERTLADYATFEELYVAFEAELEREYRVLTRALDIASVCYARYRPAYLLSSLTLDCLPRGREQQDGGARYHDYGFAPLGITSAADSLHAIQRAVYQDGFVSAGELLGALRANYVGYEALRERLYRLPKFGVEDPQADALCNRVLASTCTLATRQRTRYGGRLKPMIFNFVWTPSASRVLGARGDGARAGDLIGHGMTPRSCAMTKGITAAINSSTSLELGVVTGGATTMWDMDERWITPPLLTALLRTFLARGGMIFQGNMTSVRDLELALQHPERYPNLIVRVGGFSARFATLERALQEEIIGRYRHQG